MMSQQKMAFGERPEESAKVSKGLKMSNEASKYTKAAEEKQSFEEQANSFMDQRKARNKKAVELASQFIGVIKDKTLPENKTIMAKDVEREICGGMVRLALDMNSDEGELEGMGSVALINILLKTTLLQRDSINTLEYRLVKLEKQLSSHSKETNPSGSGT